MTHPDVPLLRIRNLTAAYGESRALHGVDLDVHEGEVVSLLGRNGAGKSTTLRSIIGLMQNRSGQILYDGKELINLPANRIARLGIGFCPEDRGIFADLSVAENLTLPPVIRPGGMSLEELQAMFPILHSRRHTQGTKLSGGEQQILAIARILRTGARFLLLDEPTEGLAPVIVHQIGDLIRTLRQRGFTILLVEQNFHFASGVADRHYVLESGHVIDMIRNEDLGRNLAKLETMLGV